MLQGIISPQKSHDNDENIVLDLRHPLDSHLFNEKAQTDLIRLNLFVTIL